MNIFSIGELVIDFIPGTEERSYIKNAGGAPANVAIAVAKSGFKSGMCCKVGDDEFGRFLIQTLEENKVKALSPQLCKEAITTMAFVTLAEDGDRSFTFARKPGADMFLAEDEVKEEDIAASDIVHAGSCSLSAAPVDTATIKALQLGHKHKKLVSFDVNYRNLMWNNQQEVCAKRVYEILSYVDILKISEEEVDMVGGEDHLFELMKQFEIAIVILTMGSKGAKGFFQEEVVEVPGRKAKVVDATGAGDAFWGAFLSSLLMQGVTDTSLFTLEKLQKAMEYGNVAGWICVQSKGAIPSLPTREQIEEVLNQ